MEQNNRPHGRETYVTNDGKGVHKRGEGLGTGPVGAQNGNPHHTQQSEARAASGGQTRASGGKGGLIAVILAAVVALGGGGGLLSGLLGGDTATTAGDYSSGYSSSYGGSYGTGGAGASGGGAGSIGSLLGGGSGASANPFAAMLQGGTASASDWASSSNVQKLDSTVAAGSRAKRTKILGGGADQVTIMVYMCGTDLESKSGMGTNDLLEMTKATLSENLKILVYTGGCTRWNNQIVSSSVNQIYEVTGGGLKCVSSNAGNDSMTKPATLTAFIQWCAKNYPANRNELIFWDHGGGSVSGYGYDEKYPRAGSMSLAGIDQALKAAGVSFDFIGFDACLMATVETGLMLDDYADYLIASEETEPGIGWYYTDWLTAFAKNPSMPTIEVGRNIADSFVATCASQCRGQSATLSVVDLAELSNTAPATLKSFSQSLSTMITNSQYSEISTARSQSREFARSSAIDQIDLVHFAQNLNTAESAALSKALLGAVKYNRTSSDMTSAYGLSIYFPYRKTGSVDSAVSTYSAIGLDDSYSKCIREFASLEVSGQVSTGGLSTSALPSLLGSLGSLSGGSSGGGADMISGLLGSFLAGGGMDFFSGRSLSREDTAEYIADHYFDSSKLVWAENGAGEIVISLPEEQWALVTGLDVNMFYDDGEGYVDLGLDNVFEFNDAGELMSASDGTWLAVNGQPVAFYHDYDVYDESGTMLTYGTVPVLLNGERAELLVVLEHGRGTVAGARVVYTDGETETVAKNMTELSEGDEIDFVCDYYSYDGDYLDSYLLGETETWSDGWQINNVPVDGGPVKVTWRFTDIYDQHYWSSPVQIWNQGALN